MHKIQTQYECSVRKSCILSDGSANVEVIYRFIDGMICVRVVSEQEYSNVSTVYRIIHYESDSTPYIHPKTTISKKE